MQINHHRFFHHPHISISNVWFEWYLWKITRAVLTAPAGRWGCCCCCDVGSVGCCFGGCCWDGPRRPALNGSYNQIKIEMKRWAAMQMTPLDTNRPVRLGRSIIKWDGPPQIMRHACVCVGVEDQQTLGSERCILYSDRSSFKNNRCCYSLADGHLLLARNFVIFHVHVNSFS